MEKLYYSVAMLTENTTNKKYTMSEDGNVWCRCWDKKNITFTTTIIIFYEAVVPTVAGRYTDVYYECKGKYVFELNMFGEDYILYIKIL